MALKKYKPTTPGRRQMTSSSFDELTTTKPEERLIKRLKSIQVEIILDGLPVVIEVAELLDNIVL
jgi:hypothetical protein